MSVSNIKSAFTASDGTPLNAFGLTDGTDTTSLVLATGVGANTIRGNKAHITSIPDISGGLPVVFLFADEWASDTFRLAIDIELQKNSADVVKFGLEFDSDDGVSGYGAYVGSDGSFTLGISGGALLDSSAGVAASGTLVFSRINGVITATYDGHTLQSTDSSQPTGTAYRSVALVAFASGASAPSATIDLDNLSATDLPVISSVTPNPFSDGQTVVLAGSNF